MYMMSRDYLAMDIDKSSLELMLRLLDADNHDTVISVDRAEYDKMRHRLHAICSNLSATVGTRKLLSLDDTTVSIASP